VELCELWINNIFVNPEIKFQSQKVHTKLCASCLFEPKKVQQHL
jgi:hypothetical protein